MEVLRIEAQPIPSYPHFMNSVSSNFRALVRLRSANFRCFCTSPSNLTSTQELINGSKCEKSVLKTKGRRVSTKIADAQLKENWLDSLTYPFPSKSIQLTDVCSSNEGSDWVIGVDPDVSGALALLKTDDSGCSAQVFDSPHVIVPVGKRTRRRLDAKSIVQLLQSFDAPNGTIAYIEQSIPYPQDGKQGWWSGGFCYGLWIGALVASGFSVVPVPSLLWKNAFKLSGSRSSKDDSRELASIFFPSTSSLLRRKKDHGRAEALLIAAYGKGLKVMPDASCILEDLTPLKQ